MTDINKKEEKMLAEMQALLADIKVRIKSLNRASREFMDLQEERNDPKASAAAYTFLAGVMGVEAELAKVHAQASRDLCDCYDNPQIVVFGGGGGR